MTPNSFFFTLNVKSSSLPEVTIHFRGPVPSYIPPRVNRPDSYGDRPPSSPTEDYPRDGKERRFWKSKPFETVVEWSCDEMV